MNVTIINPSTFPGLKRGGLPSTRAQAEGLRVDTAHRLNKCLRGERNPAKILCDMMSCSARKLSGESMVVVSQDQVSCELGGEAAILNLKAGVYYGLNEVGARIWKLIHEPKRVSEIRDTILEEYKVEPDQCEVDVMVLLQDLLDNGLIEERNESIK